MEGGWAFRETRLGCCPGRGGGRYSTIGGNFAANSLYMKNLRLRMNPQVWVRRAKAEAWTPQGRDAPLDDDPAALWFRAYHSTAPRAPGAAGPRRVSA